MYDIRYRPINNSCSKHAKYQQYRLTLFNVSRFKDKQTIQQLHAIKIINQ